MIYWYDNPFVVMSALIILSAAAWAIWEWRHR
jgi:hypothetical protein